MSKIQFQDVKFRNINEFLYYLPDEELVVTEFLRKLVFDCMPHCTEKLSYNVPYYKLNRNICFIWPASVKWGSKVTYQGVRFGFTTGYLLSDETGYLDKGSRKQVYWKDFTQISDIDVDLLKSFVFEAIVVDGR